MLMGHAEGLPRLGSSPEFLLSDPVSEKDEEADTPTEILYMASFEELAAKNVMYDTIMWVFISLMLVLAWGIGIFMLLYLPIRRYVLQREISSRKLFVTPDKIVYKVSRPSFIPCCGGVKFERQVPLSRVIDIIIEQGCLQSMFGLHTFRIESVVRGKHAPVDELLVQGLYKPGLLRKVIITEASKGRQEVGGSWKPASEDTEVENMVASPSKARKMLGSPRRIASEQRGVAPSELLLHKLDEVSESVKKLEFLLEKPHASPGNS
nr:TRNA (guanine(26)-N(2))-dimethyltransferase [Ipomoea batatas]GMD65012.1 TRNA (guanine(26)-N(2))-dimethyltransferase [Ipomoea batatas]GME12804.1 TRNA (guanine(26)-N(2))-dimethyltransferase [Ipomoea batatas]